jgi:hypothetical protein
MLIIDPISKNCLTDKVDFVKSLPCQDNNDAQKWELLVSEKYPGAIVSIRNKATGYVLTNINGETIKTEIGCDPNQNTTQLFYIRVDVLGLALVNKASNKCVKLAVSNSASIGDLIQVECTDSLFDKSWIIRLIESYSTIIVPRPAPIVVPAPAPIVKPAPAPIVKPAPAPIVVPVPAPAPVTPIETGNPQQPLKNGSCFYMVNDKNGQTVSFGGGNMEVAWSGNRGLDQTVCVENGPNGAYFIHWKKDYNQVFDIFESRTADGTRLIKYPKHGGVNQQFRFVRNNKGHYQFIAVNSGKAFGVWGNGIAQSSPTNNPEQFWQLIPSN